MLGDNFAAPEPRKPLNLGCAFCLWLSDERIPGKRLQGCVLFLDFPPLLSGAVVCLNQPMDYLYLCADVIESVIVSENRKPADPRAS